MKVIKIGAEWCSGCVVMKPRWAEIEKAQPWLKTEYLDFDQDKQKLKKYNAENEKKLPVFIFLDKKGTEFLRLHGEPSVKKLLEIILENKNN
ncbi:thioredoxin family protein [Patescibacteria group bacterium]|nr:thioredoxin family protein [Patescibacteria group bacterium]MBU0777057.1 thioredoxin family protein [Patescibacteria group bacterium]MBU0845751.1 thioredoxin family protein [Patescibacteria group bacterium]MBU0923199.1 thioredoxin family protein [Patescibacteria group bacterium]MBU1066489.1 thioredoxin family protein [Patescibacteria group bacterium]